VASRQPGHILNHVFEDGDVLAVPASENLHVLQRMLSIVTLASAVGQALRPNEDGVSRGAELGGDILALWATNHELLLVFCLVVQVVSVHIAAVLLCGH
jgi:hypothetical protein